MVSCVMVVCSVIFYLWKKWNKKLWVCIKFCLKNWIKCSTSLEMLNVAFSEFQKGCEDVKDDKCPECTPTIDQNVEKVKKLIIDNCWIIIREVTDNVGISFGSSKQFFQMSGASVAAKYVPKLLNFNKKQCRKDVAQELLNEVNNNPKLLKEVITSDETWLYGYDVKAMDELCQLMFPDQLRSKNLVNFNRMWRLCSFSLISMVL